MPFKEQRLHVLSFIIFGLLERSHHWLQSQLCCLFFYCRYILLIGGSHEFHRQYKNHADLGCRFVTRRFVVPFIVSFGAPHPRPSFLLVCRTVFFLLFPLAETLDSSFLRLGQSIRTPPGVYWSSL